MSFRGTYDHTLDSKNRLTVPAKFRAVLAAGIVLAKGVERCVAVWTPSAYDAYTEAALAGMNPLSPKARELKRFFSANAFDADLDAAGRVMVPAVLLEHGGLSRECVVAGSGECLEIWDRAAWATYNADLSGRIPDITASLASSN